MAAASGLDVVQAIATLGVDRGLTAFRRYLFVDRLGQNPLAVPADRVKITARDSVRLLGGLDSFFDADGAAAQPIAASQEIDEESVAAALDDRLVKDAVEVEQFGVPTVRMPPSTTFCCPGMR